VSPMTLDRVLFWILVATVYCLIVLAFPMPRCWRCGGRRVVDVTGSRGRRLKPRRCPVCKGYAIAPLPGARFIHAFFHATAGHYIRSKRRADAAARIEARKEPSE